jgi:hypothetical protein
MAVAIEKLEHPLAEIFIANDNAEAVDYSYGGTRMVSPKMTESEAKEVCLRLMQDESALKNKLINVALRECVLGDYLERIPKGFLESKVGGARCVIKPKVEETFSILDDPNHPSWNLTISPIFRCIGEFLNHQQGKIKLTPDFGKFAGVTDVLNQFTPHALGIRCEDGGCGGKSSYSATGVISAIETLGFHKLKDVPVTIIGSAGAMGVDILKYFLEEGYKDIAACDLAYDNPNAAVFPLNNTVKLPSKAKAFTVECLERGGLIIATTVGHELENSFWEVMPTGTTLLLAHNMAIPVGETGIDLMQRIQKHGVFALPGQILTLGGALTSRVEWFWRQANIGVPFDKPLAHSIVRDVVKFLVSEIKALSISSGLTPYEAMLHYAQTQSEKLVETAP